MLHRLCRKIIERKVMSKTNVIYSAALSYRDWKDINNDMDQVIIEMYQDLKLLAKEYAVDLDQVKE